MIRAFFDLDVVDAAGVVRARSLWDDFAGPDGYPLDRARLQREVDGLACEPGDRGVLYSQPDHRGLMLLRQRMGEITPTGGERPT